ncbi:hypothetical protein BBF96_10525 [Anoxybacter fermentans]|uniref:Uncharacterized protein n=1 Tax=Anoxybacter fermentans TaxID=1323375 RepID=A0A3Q9HR49_9FIRM|nr:hypothetical protein [Anoxybacter fermentans]AZR73782.1 hypothetical protein BBF96_10525 [Anoxybacter fermentans]
MVEKLWNMLKLIPSIAASRKNSMITGLARIEENSDELIISVYHLPDPMEFLGGREATYYAWSYDSKNNKWNKIGKLQRRNKLTFSFKKKLSPEGDGIFVTVEAKDMEPNRPGQVIISSNPELFYQDLTGESIEKIPARKEEKNDEEIKPAVNAEESIEMDLKEESYQKERVEENYEEESVHFGLEMSEGKAEEDLVEESVTLDSKEELKYPEPERAVNESEIDEEKAMLTNQFGEVLSDFHRDLSVDEVIKILKKRLKFWKKEIDFVEYWEKCKEYCCEFYEETKLKELLMQINEDVKDILDRIDLDDLWDRIEDFIKEIMELLNSKEWIEKSKCWLKEADIKEWFYKIRAYLDAILDEINPEELWCKIKDWLESILEKMDIDEILIWIKLKIRKMREMDVDEFKKECKRLFKQFVDGLKMPELKVAIFKVAVKDKVNRVEKFIQKIKDRDGFKKLGQKSRPPKSKDKRTNQKKKNQFLDYTTHINFYDNPYIFKPIPDYGSEEIPFVQPYLFYSYPCMGYMNGMCPYIQTPYQSFFRVGYDAMGEPRYFYDIKDEEYYFITPDGEIEKR